MPNTPFTAANLVAGARFLLEGRKYRVNSFMCEIEEQPVEHPMLASIFAEWDAEEAASLPDGMKRIKLRYCLPEDATYVSGSGVAGCVVGIDEIEFDGMVGWRDQQLAEHQNEAIRRGRIGSYSVTILRPIKQSEGA